MVVQQAQRAVVVLGQRGQAFHPVAVVRIDQSIALDQRRAVDVAADDAAQAAPARLLGRVALTGLSVFAIDNDARILDGMRLLLEGWGCHVTTFSGSAGLLRESQAPDLVLVDYHLDGETGLDVVRRLRARHGDALPAMLITADRSQELRAAAEAMDVQVLSKPLKPAALRSLMMRVQRLAPAAE